MIAAPATGRGTKSLQEDVDAAIELTAVKREAAESLRKARAEQAAGGSSAEEARAAAEVRLAEAEAAETQQDGCLRRLLPWNSQTRKRKLCHSSKGFVERS